MTASKLPFEVKRLIYDHVDLLTIKNLRLVSHDWAAVGIELLFLPTFVVKSSVKDLARLMNIGSRQDTARQAAKTIRTISFWSTDWDPDYLRLIVCSRHVHMQNYRWLRNIHFVPTKEEQEALEELDVLIQQKKIDKDHDESRATLVEAFKQVPLLQTLHITSPNSFKHPLLRKVWEEYNLETYRILDAHHENTRLAILLLAAKEAGIKITRLHHEQFNDNFFYNCNEFHSWDFSFLVEDMCSLTLDINDLYRSISRLTIAFHADSYAESYADRDLKAIHDARVTVDEDIPSVEVPPTTESLSLRFESLEHLAIDVLPIRAANLHSLSLSGVSISPNNFFAFVKDHAPSLRRLHLNSVELRIQQSSSAPGYDWENFLTILQDTIGNGKQLRKFQLSGVVKSTLPNGPTWMLYPIYKTADEEWERIPWGAKKIRAIDIERFVVEGAKWPMVAEDDVSSFVN